MLSRMFGTAGDGLHDSLTDFSRPVSGAYYFGPALLVGAPVDLPSKPLPLRAFFLLPAASDEPAGTQVVLGAVAAVLVAAGN